MVFSESSVNGETGGVDGDVSDENTGGDTGNVTNVGGDLDGEGVHVVVFSKSSVSRGTVDGGKGSGAISLEEASRNDKSCRTNTCSYRNKIC